MYLLVVGTSITFRSRLSCGILRLLSDEGVDDRSVGELDVSLLFVEELSELESWCKYKSPALLFVPVMFLDVTSSNVTPLFMEEEQLLSEQMLLSSSGLCGSSPWDGSNMCDGLGNRFVIVSVFAVK
jgi:hypothetical protein